MSSSSRIPTTAATALALTLGAGAATGCSRSKVDVAAFGEHEGQAVSSFTLRNEAGMVVKITNYGATVTEVHVPDRHGRLADVTLGHDALGGYLSDSPYFGATVGRVANRIAKARFSIEGRDYVLAANNGENHLHGGLRGFDKVVWTAEPTTTSEGPTLSLSHVSPDGDEGYPGEVSATVTYTLTQNNELTVEMTATTNKRTLVSMAHHTYWNLAGHDSGSILGQELMLNAESYTPTDANLIPLGTIEPVAGTAFDFTTPKPIGRDIAALTGDRAGDPGGYDVNFVVTGEAHQQRLAAVAYDPASGRRLDLYTNMPGVQLYSGNFLNGTRGKQGARYGKHAGFCLETQHFPDAVHHAEWPQPLLEPGQTYRHLMVHRFSVATNAHP